MNFDTTQLAMSLGILYYVLVYGIGVVAMILSTAAFQLKHRVAIILGNFFGQSCWVIYFLLQGDLTSAIACGLSAVMLALFSKSDKWKWTTSIVSIIFFISIFTGFSLLSFKTWKDVFPLLAGVFAVIANSRKTEKQIRQFSLFWCLFWFMNSLLKMYPVALINDSMCTVSTIIALIRYHGRTNIKEESINN